MLKKLLVATAILLAVALAAAGGGVLWLRARLANSLARLDGEASIAGLASPVSVDFDALGIPTIRAGSRVDAAAALGYVHAQERFFQMDLLRRRSAGELAQILGPDLLPIDRRSRLHRFRDVAQRAIAQLPDADRKSLEAYARGVNAGLAAMPSAPFEYMLLSSAPAPWRAEDSLLVLLSMYMELNDQEGDHESVLGLLKDVLPAPLDAFLAPSGTEWDAPVEGDPVAPVPIPGPEIFDLRGSKTASAGPAPGRLDAEEIDLRRVEGSNNFAVSGRFTANGGALLANDMHLGLTVPNTWYRAAIEWPGAAGEPGHRAIGVTLPGAPMIVAGSNTHVAWGYTNSYGDWTDLVVIETDPGDPNVYRTPDGPRRIETIAEVLHVRGAADEKLDVRTTIWGPILGADHLGRPRAIRWIAHELHGINVGLMGMETATTIEEAFDVANRTGVPPQNCVVADDRGRIGWTIMGAIPRRVGFDGTVPESWADGTRTWDGWLDPSEYPRILEPEGGRIWTANARVVDGEKLRRLGDGGYDLGARAGQIRDDLRALAKATPGDLLHVQLDDRAVLLGRWRDLLVASLTPAAVAADPRKQAMKAAVETWGARASIDSPGYRMVRAFRQFLSRQVMGSLTAACRKVDPAFNPGQIPQAEGPVWSLLAARPTHLLDPKFKTWDEQIQAAVDETLGFFKDGDL
ncbi:MAG TPA: penicillin acylase family protein, partial [Verrucomicrobiae bacterium]|nr:penicillin acylase family protein [Verrucomicrobiae bacterium]